MGFLRKVGRKIKKRVKKLFSSKFGSLIGGIAISMILGPVIGKAFNGIKSAFTGAGATAGQTAAQATSQAAAQQAAAETAKQQLVQEGLKEGITSSLTTDVGTKLTTDQLLAGETLQSVASKEVAGKALTEEALRNSLSTAVQNGNALDFTNALTQGTASGTIPLNVSNTITGSLNNINNYIETGNMFTPEVSRTIEVNQQLARAEKAVDISKQVKLGPPEATVGQEIKQNFLNLGEGIKGNDFIADTARSTGTSLALSAIQGEPEEPFISGGVAPQPDMVASQDAFVREVGNQIPDYQGVNFQNLSNSMLFGTLSPQFLIGQAQSYS
tara:strand:+ start:73 stop:1056 length:984 start_codon:yes stop_codon:yes gene_type:complete